MPPDYCNALPVCYAAIVGRKYLRRMDTSMPQDSPLVRQWVLLRTLCARHYGVTIKEMAQETGVSEKTIRRDLEMFQQAGFPLIETVTDHGRKKWRIESTGHQPDLSFAFDEAVAIYLARHLMEPLAGTVFWQAAQRAFKKIRASFGPKAIDYVERFAGMFHQTMVGTSDYTKKADLIDELMIGIEDHRAVFLTYQSLQATEPVTYDIYPYGLTYHRGSLYLIGKAPDHDEVRIWKVDRIEKAHVEELRFQMPEDFDLHEHLSKSFGVFHGDGDVHVKVRFSPTVARYVQESQWHTSQKLTKQNDGGVVAEFDLDNTEEIKRWILSFGKHAVVLEPVELCQAVIEELTVLAAAYGNGGGREDTLSARV